MSRNIGWVCFFFILTVSLNAQPAPSIAEEESAIKELLFKEVDALNKTQDLDEYMSCFAPSEEIIFGPNKNQLIKGATALKKFAGEIIFSYQKNPNKNTWMFSDWNIRIHGHAAFASCTQTTTTPSGSQIKVYKSDYLEKYLQGWKIIDHRFYHTPEVMPAKN